MIDSEVLLQGKYTGSVAEKLRMGVLQLTLADALAMGLRANLGAVAESAALQQAKGQRDVARSALLPQVDAGISEEFRFLTLKPFIINKILA